MSASETERATAEAEQAADGQTVDRGAFELLSARLRRQAEALGQAAEALNERRVERFGGSELAVIGSVRIRTEHNCVPRDIARVGDRLLFGYNVFIGLKKQTEVGDVFSCHRFVEEGPDAKGDTPGDGGPDGAGSDEPAAPPRFAFRDVDADFLDDGRFQADFRELYEYYKSTRLLQLRNLGGRLLAVFQTGATAYDHKVLRWQIEPGGARYLDNRGERDHVFDPPHDFEWTTTSREDHVAGKHPHVDVLGKVFVETVGGDLTIKVENNTEDGLGIYREPVDDPDQSLDDAEIHYAELGTLILLRVLPFREDRWRHFVFNTRTRSVERIDAIGSSCQQLPEDHGIIFPGGYHLQSGETKVYEQQITDLEFVRRIRAPNGEDVLYAFHHRGSGATLLLPYNLIRKQVQTPIRCNGYAIFDSGRMVIFRAAGEEPTRVHTMQIWQTPFCTDEYAARGTAASASTFLERLGNAELVRAVAELLSLVRAARKEESEGLGSAHYHALVRACGRALDSYHWLGEAELGEELEGRLPEGPLDELVRQLRGTAERVVDEYQKVESLRAQAGESLDEAAAQVTLAEREVRPQSFSEASQFVRGLARLRTLRGQLITLRDLRYVDRERLDGLETQVAAQAETLAAATARFLQRDDALESFRREVGELEERAAAVARVVDADPLRRELDEREQGVRLLAEVASNLEIDDALVRTAILESISEVLGSINRVRARLDARRRELRSTAAVGEFGVEFKLFGQGVSSAVQMATTPEECDDALGRLMVALEELEGRYAEFDEFLERLVTKREEVYEALSAKKQQLLDQRQRRSEQLVQASARILDGVRRRVAGVSDQDALNAFFASDPMVAKLRDQSERLRELGEVVKADELEGALLAARQEAGRSLRDRQEIFETTGDGSELVRFGDHRFSVNTQQVDLTLVPRDGRLDLHLGGTDFYQPVPEDQLIGTPDLWLQTLVSESDQIYRGEYLAASLLRSAEEALAERALAVSDEAESATDDEAGEGEDAESPPSRRMADAAPSLDDLHAALDSGELLQVVRAASAERYDEGYERGVHDADAALLLEHLLRLHSAAELLAYRPVDRALALLGWQLGLSEEQRRRWARRIAGVHRLRRAYGSGTRVAELVAELAPLLADLAERSARLEGCDPSAAARYLIEEVGERGPRFVVGGEALELEAAFVRSLRDHQNDTALAEELAAAGDPAEKFAVASSWLGAFVRREESSADGEGRRLAVRRRRQVPLVAALRTAGEELARRESHAAVETEVEGLLGSHRRIVRGRLRLRVDETLARYDRYVRERVPAFREFQRLRHELIERQRKVLRLDEFEPRVLSSFVRNQLLDQVYLPLIGDNLAKQIGAAGEGKRTDLMGLLLLISPPGYGKTTVMEYIASRLGLVFVKVNGPSLGHSVTSLDPSEARSATARQEVEKINLALEMGNNVLLYLDDIQHTSSELLQKFISLCDGQRRIEGVWRGRTRTYDLRGKRFCVCMAGNPYTESGERFQIPDMLANRADVYNLGDVLEGREDLFALSYLENSLTSNGVLAPVAARDPRDLRVLVRMARGEADAESDLGHPYSALELEEMLSVLRHLLRVQQVLLRVNRLYIESAAQDERFRTEPPFQLQGSYRNMNKLAARISAVMNQQELEALLDDHYLGEAQTLTQGAEWNLLRLRELRGVLDVDERRRIAEIRELYARARAIGGAEDDPVTRVTGTLGLVADGLRSIERSIGQASSAAVQRTAAEEEERRAPAGDEESAQALATALGQSLERTLQPAAATLAAQLAEVLARTPHGAATGAPDAGALEPILGGVGERLSDQLAQVVRSLQGIGGALSALERPAAANAGAPGASVRVVQTLGSGVHEVLDDLGGDTAEQLLELVRGISRWANRQQGEPDPRLRSLIDRTLSQLDRFKDLVNTLKRLDTASLQGAAASLQSETATPAGEDTGAPEGDPAASERPR